MHQPDTHARPTLQGFTSGIVSPRPMVPVVMVIDGFPSLLLMFRTLGVIPTIVILHKMHAWGKLAASLVPTACV